MSRYKVIEGSVSAHCCFSATVVDTGTPHPCFKGEPDWVCETYDLPTAHRIARALNESAGTVHREPS
jgi:hypothetical protein